MIPAENGHLLIAANSHPGLSGKTNEDRYSVSSFRLEDEHVTPSVLAIVSDGIGGHRAGEVAAELAIRSISKYIAESNASKPNRILNQAIQVANQYIYDEAESDPAKKGMGATCACCWIIGDRLFAANLGDSRIYLLRNNSLHQLSTDHTWVQTALDAGIITDDQVKGHPNAHIISKYLGSKNKAEPTTGDNLRIIASQEEKVDTHGIQLIPNDQLLICSDGLTDLVENHEIQMALSGKDPQENIQNLINLANSRGGHDNITVVNLIFPPELHQIYQKTADNVSNHSLPFLLILLIALIILMILLSWIVFLIHRPV